MHKPSGTTRREVLTAGAAIVATLGGASDAAAKTPTRAEGGAECAPDVRLTTPAHAVVATNTGAVRGFMRGPIFIFKGIPYGMDTGGAARFLPPRAAKPWKGTRLSINYGPVSPQATRDRNNDEIAFASDWDDGYASEDCLRVNVWSPSLDAKAKLPVMVWLHGGGFFAGSSQELAAYDGENLARQGVVIVSVNHRLGPLGFMDLAAAGGEAFQRSSNVGMLDLVLALEWVRDNIGGFGGDASRVTIFGHSGGGGKVSTLMAMPGAKGLFHRAIVMSGSFPAGMPRPQAQALAAATMEELGVKGDVQTLQRVDTARLMIAADAAAKKLSAAAGAGFPMRIGFGPVVDTPDLPHGWAGGAPRLSANVPLIVGNVRDEFRSWTLPQTDADLPQSVPPPLRSKASEIVAALRKDYPNLPASEIAAMIGGLPMRNLALDQARKHHALGGANVYSYWFTWATPVLDGRLGSPHGIDLPPAFDNVARCDQFTGNDPDAQKIAKLMSRAWVNFATTGNPSQEGLDWPVFEPVRGATMVFDATTRLEYDPAGVARKLMTPPQA
jgi:para-nitrobenzyl esterase